MSVPVKVLLVHSEPETAQEIRAWFAAVEDIEIVESTHVPVGVPALVAQHSPDVVLMDDRMPEAYEISERIGREFMNSGVVVLASAAGPEALRRGMRAGVRDVLIPPYRPLDLANAIYRAHDFMAERRRAMPQAVAPAAPETAHGGTKIITVFSPKGGVGKSTIATNLAVSLALKKGRDRVVLWDLDLHNGVANVQTDVIPRRPITDLINEIQYLDPEMLENYLEKHGSGLQVLCAPFTPEFADYISGEHVDRILEVLRESKEYVIIDTAAFFQDAVMTAMEQSDWILLVGTLDMACVKNLKAGLMVMDSLQYPSSKIKLVINQGDVEYGVLPRDVEATLEMPIFCTLPRDVKTAVTALNEGIPVVRDYPKSDLGRAFSELGDLVRARFERKAPERVSEPRPKRGGFFRRLKHA